MQTQRWLITGAARGLGRALTEAALDAGHAVVATVRGPHDLPHHERLEVCHLDVRDRAGARALIQDVASAGALDVLINNAGYGLIGATEELPEDEARAILETNLLGALWLSQAAITPMRARGRGHIVQISTVGAVGTMPMLGMYNASKWGLEAFSESMASEVGTLGIRVSIIEPGALDTAWASTSMRFAPPASQYRDLRTSLFGTSETPWPAPTGPLGTDTAAAARAILDHIADPNDRRLRVLVGVDAPAQAQAALHARVLDYERDPRTAPRPESP